MRRDEGGEPLSVADVVALTRMFEEHRPRLLGMLQGRIDPALRARVSADQVLQEAFFLARRRWERFATSGMAPYAWLYRISRDTLFEVSRREARDCRDPHREVPWPERSADQQVLGLIASATSPSEAFAREELLQRVRAVLAQLKPIHREVLRMRHFEHLSIAEIAMVLKIPVNTAVKRYARALQRLRDLLPDLYSREGEGDGCSPDGP